MLRTKLLLRICFIFFTIAIMFLFILNATPAAFMNFVAFPTPLDILLLHPYFTPLNYCFHHCLGREVFFIFITIKLKREIYNKGKYNRRCWTTSKISTHIKYVHIKAHTSKVEKKKKNGGQRVEERKKITGTFVEHRLQMHLNFSQSCCSFCSSFKRSSTWGFKACFMMFFKA